jgi:hypothetical protein
MQSPRIDRKLPRAPTVGEVRRHLPLSHQSRAVDRSWRPSLAVWELTLRCDLACRHCSSRAGHARADELTTSEALDLVGQLAELGSRPDAGISSSGTGGSSNKMDATADSGFDNDAGLFCGGVVCDRQSQFCETTYPISSTTGHCTSIVDARLWTADASTCGSIPDCACLGPLVTSSCHCTEGAGGIIVSCHTCYGSPPARLEWLELVA